jgi:pyruvate/2-oxoglutarate dehydrogenase complex dihydrolipoamide dehydrogenase (E3) component
MGAASLGVPVVLVERGPMEGQGRRASARIGSAALLAAAARAQAVRTAKNLGINANLSKVDFPAVRAHVERAVSALAPNASAERLQALGIRVIRAEGSFLDPRTLQAGETAIRARRFVVATGTVPDLPDIDGLDPASCLTPETILTLSERPDRLAILGAEPEALELAQAFRRLGSEVALIAPKAPLSDEDPEFAEEVLAALKREGIVFHAPVALQRAEPTEKGIRLFLEGENGTRNLTASHVLATAHQPDVAGLGLDRAGIQFGADGIAVNSSLRTANRRVYAVGAVRGGPHAAAQEAGVALRNLLFRVPARLRPEVLPRALRTDPELAHVGLTEAEARQTAGTISVFRWPYAENERAQADGSTTGHIRIVTDRAGRTLGVSIVGAGAAEMILAWAGPVARKAPLAEMTDLAPSYPALGDIGRAAALGLHVRGLTKPGVRRIMSLLRKLG